MGVVHLAFKSAARPIAGLILRVEIDSAIGAGFGLHFDLEIKIFERLVVADVIKVAAIAVCNERPIDNLPRFLVLVGSLPAVKSFAVHQRNEAGFQLRSADVAGASQQSDSKGGENEMTIHGAELNQAIRRRKSKLLTGKIITTSQPVFPSTPPA